MSSTVIYVAIYAMRHGVKYWSACKLCRWLFSGASRPPSAWCGCRPWVREDWTKVFPCQRESSRLVHRSHWEALYPDASLCDIGTWLRGNMGELRGEMFTVDVRWRLMWPGFSRVSLWYATGTTSRVGEFIARQAIWKESIKCANIVYMYI